MCEILQLAAGTGVDCSARHLPNDVTRLHFTQSEERKLNFQDDSRCRGDVPGEVRGAVGVPNLGQPEAGPLSKLMGVG